MSNISLQEIADKLNISRVTVSKVLNNKSGVSQKTRDKVNDALVCAGYKKLVPYEISDNNVKVQPKTKFIVILATEPDYSTFWTRIINTISVVLSQTCYDIIYSFIPTGKEESHVLPKVITALEASGIILINVYSEKLIEGLSAYDIPKVYLDIPSKYMKQRFYSDVVLLEGKKSIYEITSRIIQNGKRKIGFIGDVTYAETIALRYQGFKMAMKEHNLKIQPEFCFLSEPSSHFYDSALFKQKFLELESFPEAFVCANDAIASMIIEVLSEKGLSVPDDIFVSGFDNISEMSNQASILTTVDVDLELLAERLVQQILFKIDKSHMPNEIVLIDSTVVLRESTGSVK